MHSYIVSRYDRFLQDLETLVHVDSGSGHTPGLATVAQFFQERFDRLGWHTRALEFDCGSAPCLEVVNRGGDPATGRFDFLLLGHMDTVFPADTARQRPFSILDGRSIRAAPCLPPGWRAFIAGSTPVRSNMRAALKTTWRAGLRACWRQCWATPRSRCK